MTSSKGRVKLAALLAAGFLALRLVYAFVFSGLSGNQVLLSLPELQLAGPFRHITLFGDVSAEGILRNIELALPFALSIIAFGLLASFVTPERVRLAARRFRPLRNLLTALAIALAAIPGVISAAKEANWARKLRGETRLSVLVPILERMVQRATALGLELAKSVPVEAKSKTLVVSGFKAAGLGPISEEIAPGEIAVLSGPTGSGKSTFLLAIAGELAEHQGRSYEGSILLGEDPLDSLAASKFVALVPQLPQQSFIAGTVEEELGAEAIAADLMGVAKLASKATHLLSHGEAYRVAVARAVLRKPAVLLVDEPTAALDLAGLGRLARLVSEVSSEGTTVLIADHRPELIELPNAKALEIFDGQLTKPHSREVEPPALRKVVVGSELVARIKMTSVGQEVLIRDVDLGLRQAECLAITGANGTGKSTLLRQLAQPAGGELAIFGVELVGSDPRKVALVPDRPSQFFVCDSLGSELARADKIAGAKPGLTAISLESILGKLPNLNAHPLDLSVGTQLALSVAMQLSHKPQLLLLDEPVQGLDPESRELMAETIRCVQETGCAVIIATHDLGFARRLTGRVLEISNKELQEAREVLA